MLKYYNDVVYFASATQENDKAILDMMNKTRQTAQEILNALKINVDYL